MTQIIKKFNIYDKKMKNIFSNLSIMYKCLVSLTNLLTNVQIDTYENGFRFDITGVVEKCSSDYFEQHSL